MSDEENSQARQEGAEMPAPEADFSSLVFSLYVQAQANLGLIGHKDEKPQPDLRAARYTIDLMAMLQAKTKGNLTLEENRLIENSLTELRFRFVNVQEETGRATSQQA